MKLFNTFLNDESGAVTVDWVVLTAAIVGLGIAVMSSIGTAAIGVSDDIATSLDATQVGVWSAS